MDAASLAFALLLSDLPPLPGDDNIYGTELTAALNQQTARWFPEVELVRDGWAVSRAMDCYLSEQWSPDDTDPEFWAEWRADQHRRYLAWQYLAMVRGQPQTGGSCVVATTTGASSVN